MLVDDFWWDWHKDDATNLILLNLSGAFNTINHDIPTARNGHERHGVMVSLVFLEHVSISIGDVDVTVGSSGLDTLISHFNNYLNLLNEGI